MIDGAILEGLRRAGLIGDIDQVIEELSGGVSCDVWKLETPARAIVVKRALPKLRVESDWFAPVDRAGSEARWLRRVRSIDAGLAPEVLVELPELHAFALAFVPDAPVWKDELIAGRVDIDFAAAVGRDLARIHAATADSPIDAAAFRVDALFNALRIDPFLRFVAENHSDVAAPLTSIADSLSTAKVTLIHGDVSPKNILVGVDGPVFLDAECAVYGDPAFDLAFCATHLLLKALWRRDEQLTKAAAALEIAYRGGVGWEPADNLLDRAGALTAALLLARVDGKSPAPYLTDLADQAIVRKRASTLLHAPQSLAKIIAEWKFKP